MPKIPHHLSFGVDRVEYFLLHKILGSQQRGSERLRCNFKMRVGLLRFACKLGQNSVDFGDIVALGQLVEGDRYF